MHKLTYEVAVIGAGPAGLAAAGYTYCRQSLRWRESVLSSPAGGASMRAQHRLELR